MLARPDCVFAYADGQLFNDESCGFTVFSLVDHGDGTTTATVTTAILHAVSASGAAAGSLHATTTTTNGSEFASADASNCGAVFRDTAESAVKTW